MHKRNLTFLALFLAVGLFLSNPTRCMAAICGDVANSFGQATADNLLTVDDAMRVWQYSSDNLNKIGTMSDISLVDVANAFGQGTSDNTLTVDDAMRIWQVASDNLNRVSSITLSCSGGSTTEQTCSGVSGFCVDVVGAKMDATSRRATVTLQVFNATDISAGAIRLSFDSSKLTYVSSELGTALTGSNVLVDTPTTAVASLPANTVTSGVKVSAVDTATAGSFRMAFANTSSTDKITSTSTGATLVSIIFQVATGVTAAPEITVVSTASQETNFTKNDYSLIASSAQTVKSGLVTLQ